MCSKNVLSDICLLVECAEPHGSEDPRSRVHTSLVVVLLIAIISSLVVVAFILYKRSPRSFPTFENPLYFNNEKSQPDVIDTNKLIENAENTESFITLWFTKTHILGD